METTHTCYVREVAALLTAGIAYWLTIYPRARREIHRCRRRAHEIPDPTLRAAALDKLTRERLNPEAAAFFAVLAPCRRRGRLVRLMVDFQIAYDYLDAINEQPTSASLRNGLLLHRALTDAVRACTSGTDYYGHHPQIDDGGYLSGLVEDCQSVMAALPSTAVLEPVLVRAAERCGQAQSRNHALVVEGDRQLHSWAAGQAPVAGYLWWELAAGGISCLAIHALFAAAARGTTRAEAERIDAAYFPPVCAISALLDSLIDYSHDAAGINHSFVAHYATCSQAAQRFAAITAEAHALLGMLKNRARHMVILAGIASFYLSAPEARSDYAAPVASRTLERLGAASAPMLAVMRLKRRQSG